MKNHLVHVKVFSAYGDVIKVCFPLDKKTYEVINNNSQDEDHKILFFTFYYRDYVKEERYQRLVSHYIEDVEDNSNAFLVPDSAMTPDEYLTASERLERLNSRIRMLKAKQRRAIVLFFCDGRSKSEIAKDMGVSVTAVTGLLNRALSKLKKLLGDDFLDEF